MLNKLTHAFNEFWKVIWPIDDSEAVLNPKGVFKKYSDAIACLKYSSEKTILQELYKNCQDIYKEEEKRRLNIVQKASLSLSATGASSAIIVGLASLLLNDKFHWDGIASILILISYLVALFYFLRSIKITLRNLGRKQNQRYCIGPDDLPPESRNESQYYLHLSQKYLEYTTENYKLNNRQLSSVGVSQECFRNGIFILLIMCGIVIVTTGINAKTFGGDDDSKKDVEVRLILGDDKRISHNVCFCQSRDWPFREIMGINEFTLVDPGSYKLRQSSNQLRGK